MNRYAVRLEGRDFKIRKESGPELLGFFTTRFVLAESEESAELAAVALVREDESLQSVTISESDKVPMIYMDDIWECSDDQKLGGRGYTFFPMEEP